jgi:hypothetical protein
MDYRQPIEPAVIVLAVAGVLSLRRPDVSAGADKRLAPAAK